MRRLVWESSFRRASKRVIRRSPSLEGRVFQVLGRQVENPSDPILRTHKLSGRLSGLWACWVEYDCRIIFAFKPDPASGEPLILLVDIGAHGEVY
jgi:mRNA-degrading endonuclease YafQ of YafQ-DinJ toxin-antitoxin module